MQSVDCRIKTQQEDKMKKHVFMAIVLLGFAFIAAAEDEPAELPEITETAVDAADPLLPEITPTPEEGWKKPVITGGLNVSQGGFHNWVSGGENSFAWQVSLDGSIAYAGKIKWANTFKVKYGQMTTDSSGTRKSDDEVKIESIGEYDTGILVNPYLGLMAQTQMMPGYDYTDGKVEISRFMAPGYTKESVGAAITIENVLMFRAGAALKQTIAVDHCERYDVDPVYKFKNEPGLDLAFQFDAKLLENLLFKSLTDTFTNFTTFDAIDIKLDNNLTAKINEFVNVNLNFVILYDKDLSKGVQMKETLSLGVTYNFL